MARRGREAFQTGDLVNIIDDLEPDDGIEFEWRKKGRPKASGAVQKVEKDRLHAGLTIDFWYVEVQIGRRLKTIVAFRSKDKRHSAAMVWRLNEVYQLERMKVTR